MLACRDQARGKLAADRIAEQVEAPRATARRACVEVVSLDLANLESIEDAACDIADRTDVIDILVNNAGVMVPPATRTIDGFESHMGVNHLGHFALTGRLLAALLAADAARVVTVSSLTYRAARPNFENLRLEQRGSRVAAYGRSKLANLMFARELDRRAKAAGASLRSMAAHPGLTNSRLAANSALGGAPFGTHLVAGLWHVISQSTGAGALPPLYAATEPGLRGGEFIGPRGPGGTRGAPGSAYVSRTARDTAAAARLWELSIAATGVGYEELRVTRR
jgi:NAD(P)-dependent dehydrogenase (short-subunit alcohol dehydrogenase family)